MANIYHVESKSTCLVSRELYHFSECREPQNEYKSEKKRLSDGLVVIALILRAKGLGINLHRSSNIYGVDLTLWEFLKATIANELWLKKQEQQLTTHYNTEKTSSRPILFTCCFFSVDNFFRVRR